MLFAVQSVKQILDLRHRSIKNKIDLTLLDFIYLQYVCWCVSLSEETNNEKSNFFLDVFMHWGNKNDFERTQSCSHGSRQCFKYGCCYKETKNYEMWMLHNTSCIQVALTQSPHFQGGIQD